jgi:5,10-methenyltetrahydromethanopterin hydrogenase
MEVQAVMELHQALQVHQSLTQVAVEVVHLLVVTEVVLAVQVAVEEEQMVLVDQME